jgi:O-antigen/teichoic acid export membrane protein
MSVLKQNILANFLGKGWSLLLMLICVPFTIRFVGVEAYGLVGFFATLQATVGLLDFGLSATMNREMARSSVYPEKSDEARNLARTLEIVYWLVGLIIGIGAYWAAPWLAINWVKAELLPISIVQQALVMMGIIIALQWPIGLYSGGLMGLEKQVWLNTLLATFGTVRNVGALLVLWLIAPTILVYFLWQIAVSVIQVVVITLSFWRNLPGGAHLAQFDLQSLRRVWRFTAGMSATAFMTFLISQLDKIVLSNVLTLEMFGYYALANQLSTAIRMSSAPIFTAMLPHFSALVAKGDTQTLRRLYHQSCQIVSVVVLPASAVVAFFSFELISLWTGNEATAQRAAQITSLLVIGSALNSLMGIPYDLTVAYGWTSLGFYQNMISAIFLVPAMIVLATYVGGVGAAIVWVILNTGYILISAPLIHHRILKGELRQWYGVDIGWPLVVSFTVAGLGWLMTPKELTVWPQILVLAAISSVTLAAGAISLPFVRQKIWHFINLRKTPAYVTGKR